MNYKKSIVLLALFISLNSSASYYTRHLSSLWYPLKAKVLMAGLNRIQISTAKKWPIQPKPSGIRAILSPHSPYAYSGSVAMAAYQTLPTRAFNRVIILAPIYQSENANVIMPGREYQFFQTSNGKIAIDQKVMAELENGSSLFRRNQSDHEHEHAIEIQIPFIERYCKNCAIVPLLVGAVSDKDLEKIAKKLQLVLDDKTLLVVSSDLSSSRLSFGAILKASKELSVVDIKILQQIKNGDSIGFCNEIQRSNVAVDGQFPLRVLMELIKNNAFGVVKARTVAHESFSSGSSYVGYGSIVFAREWQ